ncbi:hypothetical protein [Fodinibius saliphilus]|uniref:hypothetical protein n=1 Tax=Fodinibius saliphilus TaxID=1920650 RepID=UPI001107BE1D|nr:hypothetical protein [Fodinibius saliphilus]
MATLNKTKQTKLERKLAKKLLSWDQQLDDLEKKIHERFNKLRRDYRNQIADIKQVRLEIRKGLEELESPVETSLHSETQRVEQLWNKIEYALSESKYDLPKT